MSDHNLKHATYGASSAERWTSCPGSVRLSQLVSPLPTSEAASEGSLAHEVFAEFLNSKNMDQTFHDLIQNSKYSFDMVHNGKSFAEWVLNQVKLEDALFVEYRVNSESFTLPNQFGTLDAAIVSDNHISVIDYKYGFNPVDPTDNQQLIYYALALCDELRIMPDSIDLVILQPRIMDGSGSIKVFNCGSDTLEFWREKFMQAVAESLDYRAFLSAGKWCRYCPAALVCDEFLNRTINFQEDSYLEKDMIPKFSGVIPPGAESRFGEFLEAAELMEIFISQVKSRSFQILNNGGQIPGYKLVERRPTRKWKDENIAAASLSTRADPNLLYSRKLNSPAVIEKIVGKAVVESLTEKKSSGLTMVREEDKRDSVDNNVFTVVSSDELAMYGLN